MSEESREQPESVQEILCAAPEGAAEEELISQGTWGAITALRERGMSKKAIAREPAC
jgi:hypothetical protein